MGAYDEAIDRVIDVTARVEGGGRYDAWNPDDRGHGVSYGLIQFNQKVGPLPDVFQAMFARNSALFSSIFGNETENFLNQSWVKHAELNSSPYYDEMLEAAQQPEFQQAQRDLARSIYFNQAETLALESGLTSERAYGMLFDTFVQRGPASTQRAMEDALSAAGPGASEADILSNFSVTADSLPGGQVTSRRQNLLVSSALSDAPFGSTRAAMSAFGTDVATGANIVRLAGVGLVAYLLWRYYKQRRG